LMHVPYYLQLAHGWTRLTIYVNTLSIFFIVPAIFWATPRYGPEGAAWIWIILNASYVLIAASFMYQKLIKSEKWRWYFYDLLYPLLGATVGALGCKWIFRDVDKPLTQLFSLVVATVVSLILATLSSRDIRKLFAFQKNPER
jgi:hypothetical protein